MQLWSSDKSAFVDFADGYSYLPGLPVLFGISRAPIQLIELSTVLHEFTHQLALIGPFGWLCAYFQALRYLCKRSSELQAALEQASPETQAVFEETPQAREGWEVSVFYDEYSDVISNFKDLITCYRPLLEGMALYTQFDFVPSRTYDAASEPFFFLFELYNTEWRFPATQLATLEDLETLEAEVERRKSATESRTEADDQTLQEYICALFDEIKNAGFTSGLLRMLMESTSSETAPYYWGYLMVKQIQRLLTDKDPRLADAEVYFIFMQSYLFCDPRLINLCIVASRPTYQQYVLTFLYQSIAELVNAHPEYVRAAVDSICDYTRAAIDYPNLDFAAAVRSGEIVSWRDGALYEQYSEQIWAFVKSIDSRLVTFEHPDIGLFIRELWGEGRRTIGLFDRLSKLMLSFKLRHTHRALLNFDQDPDSHLVYVSSAEPGVSFFLKSPISPEEFEPLKEDMMSGSFTFANSDEKLNPPLDNPEFFQTLAQYYQEDKLFILQDYDLYLLQGRKRCRVWVRNSFLHVEQVPLGPAATPRQIRSQGDLLMLKLIGRMFHHAVYFPWIRITEFVDRPLAPQDNDLEQEVYLALWSLVYPHGIATQKELSKFALQKAKLIAASGVERAFLRTLCINQQVEVDQNQSIIQTINRRWRHYTGRDLIVLSETATGTTAQLQL